jgi:dihydroorotase
MGRNIVHVGGPGAGCAAKLCNNLVLGASMLAVAEAMQLGKRLGVDAGVLAAGVPADLILFDPGAPVVVEADALKSKSKNSPFDGRRLQGKVLLTVVGGRIVHDTR